VADSPNYVVSGFRAFFYGDDFHRIGVIVRTKDQVAVGYFYVLDGAVSILANGIHVLFGFSVRSQRVVVAIEEEGSSGEHTGVHAHAFSRVYLDDNKALPGIVVPLNVFAEATEEGSFELQDLFDVHVHDKRFVSGNLRGGDDDAFEFVGAGGDDGGAFVYFGRVKQVEHGNVLDGKDLVHAFEAESALAIQEVGDMGLFESGLSRQVKAGQIAFIDALPESLAEIVLKGPEFHKRKYSTQL
jgi:hypothetical protein